MLQPQYLQKAVSKIMSDKRDTDRVKSVFSGVIMVDGQFRCHCIIRDVSTSGMKLEFQDINKVPEKFHIKTPALPGSLPVVCVWKRHMFMGVQFVSDEDFESFGMVEDGNEFVA